MSDQLPPKTVPASPSWHRGKAMAIAAFVTVAFAGVLSGAALDRYVLYLWGRPAAGPPGVFPGGPRDGPPDDGRFRGRGGRGGPPEIPRLMRALDLSPAQQAGIDSVLDRQGKKLQEVRERIRPQIDSLVAETEREVEARLTPDQRTRYSELRSEIRRAGRGRRGGPPR
jgi:Spy/CpxP family protein refolding chaperone